MAEKKAIASLIEGRSWDYMTLRIGIIGTGWFSKVHADILSNMDGVDVTAFVGTSLEKAAQAVRGYRGQGLWQR